MAGSGSPHDDPHDAGGSHDGHGSHDDHGFHDHGFHDGHGFHGGGPHDVVHHDRGPYGGIIFDGGSHGGFYGGGHVYGRPVDLFDHPHFHNRFFFSLGVGTLVWTLPLHYDTFYSGGVPYYYYGNTYYTWNDARDQYQVVDPPAAAPTMSEWQASSGELFAYPTMGQSADQQQTDRDQCHAWAVGQTGFDPSDGMGGSDTQRDNYFRAEGTCLGGRGYAVQ